MRVFQSLRRTKTAVKPLLLLFTLVCPGSTFIVSADESTLQWWANQVQHSAPKAHPPVAVTAFYKRASGKDFLAFMVTNISKKPLTFPVPYLPWSYVSSIRFAAITTDGKELPIWLAIDDSAGDPEITLASGESRQGDYDLTGSIDFTEAKGKDVLVFWSYLAPSDSRQPRVNCTGVVVIPKAR